MIENYGVICQVDTFSATLAKCPVPKEYRSMIAESSTRLLNWVKDLDLGADSLLSCPSAEFLEKEVISIYLFEVEQGSVSAGSTKLNLLLRYLVTSFAPDDLNSHQLLGHVMKAAVLDRDLNTNLDPPSPIFWASLNLCPRPAFMIEVEQVFTITTNTDTQIVKQPLVIKQSLESNTIVSDTNQKLNPRG